MPVEPLVDAAVQVVAEVAVQATGEITSEVVKRRFGWKGCMLAILGVTGLAIGFYYLLA